MSFFQNEYFQEKERLCAKNDTISKDLFQEFGVKAGLRDEKGKTDNEEGKTYVELTSKAVELMLDEKKRMERSYRKIQEEIGAEELELNNEDVCKDLQSPFAFPHQLYKNDRAC